MSSDSEDYYNSPWTKMQPSGKQNNKRSWQNKSGKGKKRKIEDPNTLTKTPKLSSSHQPASTSVRSPMKPQGQRKMPFLKLLSAEEFLERLCSIVNLGDPTKIYDVLAVLSEGSFGTVVRAVENKTGTEVAIKVIDLDELVDKEPCLNNWRNRYLHVKRVLTLNEIVILKEQQHPNIVNFLKSYLLDDQLMIVMEYVNAGSLANTLEWCRLDEGQIAAVCREICCATLAGSIRTCQRSSLLSSSARDQRAMVRYWLFQSTWLETFTVFRIWITIYKDISTRIFQ